MDFSDNVTHLVVEIPSSLRTAIYIVVCFSITLFFLYEWVLWRYMKLNKRSKIWFSLTFACVFAVTLITIFVENFFE